MFWLKIGWQHLLVGIMPGIISAMERRHQNRSCFCKVCTAHPQGVSMLKRGGECCGLPLKSGRHEKLGQICAGCRPRLSVCLGFARNFLLSAPDHSDLTRSRPGPSSGGWSVSYPDRFSSIGGINICNAMWWDSGPEVPKKDQSPFTYLCLILLLLTSLVLT